MFLLADVGACWVQTNIFKSLYFWRGLCEIKGLISHIKYCIWRKLEYIHFFVDVEMTKGNNTKLSNLLYCLISATLHHMRLYLKVILSHVRLSHVNKKHLNSDHFLEEWSATSILIGLSLCIWLMMGDYSY